MSHHNKNLKIQRIPIAGIFLENTAKVSSETNPSGRVCGIHGRNIYIRLRWIYIYTTRLLEYHFPPPLSDGTLMAPTLCNTARYRTVQ